MKRGKLNTYIVSIRGAKNTWKIKSYSKNGAITQVWNDIKSPGYYKYGVISLADLKKKAKVERV